MILIPLSNLIEQFSNPSSFVIPPVGTITFVLTKPSPTNGENLLKFVKINTKKRKKQIVPEPKV